WPIYIYLLGQVDSSLCNKNMGKIGEALLTYVRDNDDHLPYVYEREGYGSDEIALHDGYAYTWQWAVEPYTTGGWAPFRCPAAEPAEHTKMADPMSGVVEISDYGMPDAYSGRDLSTISNPDQKVIVGDTSNRGALGTYDPLPLTSGGTPLAYDGFEIGFNDSQVYPRLDVVSPSGSIIPGTRSATRLAFPHSADGKFDHESDSRHPGGIHFLTVGGGLLTGDGAAANVIQLTGGFGGLWDVPRPTP
ncbi:MAG TPA: hypothetical protein VMI31_13965, partial [Fimbriimonadaceae bacterium]|nr:hypothetical protein [Fimbriimonadaceae bacterium]